MDNGFKICAEHHWPQRDRVGSIDSTGTVHVRRCNNCVAVQIVFKHHDMDGTLFTSTKVVVPD